MTKIGTLWGDIRQRQSKVIVSVAAANGFELDQPKWTFANRPEEYTAKFPYGKVPAFEGNDGFTLTEGTAIARYLSSIGTAVGLGSNVREVALVDQWVHFAEFEIGIPTQNITGMIYGYSKPFSVESIDGNHERVVRALAYLESHLAKSTSGYVVLDTLTLADFMLAGSVYIAARFTLGSVERAQYPHVFAHYAKVTADERVKQYWGTADFADARIREPQTIAW